MGIKAQSQELNKLGWVWVLKELRQVLSILFRRDYPVVRETLPMTYSPYTCCFSAPFACTAAVEIKSWLTRMITFSNMCVFGHGVIGNCVSMSFFIAPNTYTAARQLQMEEIGRWTSGQMIRLIFSFFWRQHGPCCKEVHRRLHYPVRHFHALAGVPWPPYASPSDPTDHYTCRCHG